MALVLPLLTLLLIGIINMGLVIREHQVLQNAAREGARYSTLQGNRITTAGDATLGQTRPCTWSPTSGKIWRH